jgi:HD-GYP domain-containing protein (c-di-GMP phosphodiesterase class II)
MITGGATTEEKLRALEEGVTDFLAKPFKTEELLARVRSSIQMKRATDALEDAENVIIALAKVIDARDPYTCFHSDRVSGARGIWAGDRPPRQATPCEGRLFHDRAGRRFRRRAHKLTADAEEMAQMKRHPVEGRRLLVGMKSLSYALDVVYHHLRGATDRATRWPFGEEIPLVARVTTIADIYDALTTARVYRAALSPEEALGIMKSEAEKGWWDVRLLEAFRGVLSKVPDSLAPESLGRIRN